MTVCPLLHLRSVYPLISLRRRKVWSGATLFVRSIFSASLANPLTSKTNKCRFGCAGWSWCILIRNAIRDIFTVRFANPVSWHKSIYILRFRCNFMDWIWLKFWSVVCFIQPRSLLPLTAVLWAAAQKLSNTWEISNVAVHCKTE